MTRIKGTVKWFSNRKGYGFLDFEGAVNDVFVHYSSILEDGYRSLHQGDPVEFDLLDGKKGPQAQNVAKLPSDGAQPNNS